MNRNNHIVKELKEIAPGISDFDVAPPFKVPEGYFNEFPLQMKLAIVAKSSYSVPDGYFEGFAETMLSRVNQGKGSSSKEDAYPILDRISKEMPFSIPEGYFDHISIPVTARTANKQPAKVVQISFRERIRQFSAAAAVLITIGLAWFIFQMNPPRQSQMIDNQSNVETVLTTMEDSMLNDYLYQNSESAEFATYLLSGTENMEKTLATLPTDELSAYLNDHPILSPGS